MKSADQHINYGGKLTQRASAALFSNRAFRYGDGLFESIRVIDGRPLFWADHYHRLAKGMQIMQLRTLDSELLYREIIKLLDKNALTEGGYVRLSVWRAGGGKYGPESDDAEYMIEAGALPNRYEAPTGKVILTIYPTIKKSINLLSGIKSINALLYVLAARYAQSREVSDSIIQNESGQLIESHSGNLFWIKGEQLFTPPLSSGPLEGVMRKQVMRLAGGQYRSVEKAATAEDLFEADELFLSNAIQGIRPVNGFMNRRYFTRQGMQLLHQLNRLIHDKKNLSQGEV